MTKTFLVGAALAASIVACGGDKKEPPKTPDTTTPPASTATASGDAGATTMNTTATPAAGGDAGPGPAETAKPAMKGNVNSFARAANSGKVDKVGSKDGDFKPDGVKDVVFDVDYDGPATALFVMTCDATGAITGEFDADSLIGDQNVPQEIAGILHEGKNTHGLAIYEGDKLLNGKDGGLSSPLPDGKHKLALHISSKSVPKSAFRVFVLLPDGTLVKGPVLPKT